MALVATPEGRGAIKARSKARSAQLRERAHTGTNPERGGGMQRTHVGVIPPPLIRGFALLCVTPGVPLRSTPGFSSGAPSALMIERGNWQLGLFFVIIVSLLALAVSMYSLGYARGFYGRKNVGVLGAFFFEQVANLGRGRQEPARQVLGATV